MNTSDLLSPEELAELVATPSGTLFADARLPVTGVGTKGDVITIKHFITPEELLADMRINPLDIQNAMITLSSHYARYTHLLAKARLQKDDAERRLELLEAKLDKAIRDQAAVDKVKLTEPNIAAMIRRQTTYIESSLQFNEARAVYQVLEGAVSAMDKKHSMLVQLNKNQNADYDRSTTSVGSSDAVEGAKARLMLLKK